MVNTWPKGFRHAMYPEEHEAWNSQNYPGTRQLCAKCDAPTERCEEDSMYVNGDGPLCKDCYTASAEEAK